MLFLGNQGLNNKLVIANNRLRVYATRTYYHTHVRAISGQGITEIGWARHRDRVPVGHAPFRLREGDAPKEARSGFQCL